MSTIAEHIAALEMYKALDENRIFAEEAYLFTQVHWRDLAAILPVDEMQKGRDEIERRIRAQHPERAEEFIGKWRAAIPARASSSRAEVEQARELELDMYRTFYGTLAPRRKAVTDVLAERQRQVTDEQYEPDADDQYTQGELAYAAAAYAITPAKIPPIDLWAGLWPWAVEAFKPTDARRNLVKAGALILAEIERIDRLAAAEAPNKTQD